MSIIIRNLTPINLQVKKVDCFRKPDSESGATSFVGHLAKNITSFVTGIASFAVNITKSITGFAASSSTPEHTELPHDATPNETHEKDLRIDAFRTTATNIQAPVKDETVRLFFEADGQQYRIDLPVTQRHSVTMTPLGDHKYEFTVVYSREHSHLAIFSTANLNAWMRSLKDKTPLTGLSMPGTHNSPTCHRALPSVRCQAVSPREQMENGVRFFDLRAQVEKPENPNHDGLILVHSFFPISFTGTKYFRTLANEILDFLRNNPSETMVVSLKREGTGEGTDELLSNVLRKHYAADEQQWYTSPHIPTLGEARGKIVLLRRFRLSEDLKQEHNGHGWGINAETWADNTPHAFTPDNAICIQDFYEVLETESIEKKVKYSIEQLERAAATVTPLHGMQARSGSDLSQQPFFINFLSASNFWKQGCWPEKIAARLNPAVVDYLCRRHNNPETGKQVGDGATGVVICDWVGDNGNWDLVRCIVGHNARLEQREHDA